MFRKIKIENQNSLTKLILIILGFLSLGLGILGLFVPILPTTPFLLLSAYLFSKSSRKMYIWINSNRVFGKYIKRYIEGLGIPLKTKILSISTLWITISISVYFFVHNFWLGILLILIAIAVSYHLLSKPTFKNKD